MKSEEKMRGEFEAWAKSQGYEIAIDKSGFYALHETESGWEAWKASRESLVIELQNSNKSCSGHDDLTIDGYPSWR